jgi:hypothetical protein
VTATGAGAATTGAGIGAVGCALRMLSNARVQGRQRVDPGSDGAPQLSHGPTLSTTVGACDGSDAWLSVRPHDGQDVRSSTTLVWHWSQYTRCSPAPGYRRPHVSPSRNGRKLFATYRMAAMVPAAGLQVRDGL